jgi:hypothetical protein
MQGFGLELSRIGEIWFTTNEEFLISGNYSSKTASVTYSSSLGRFTQSLKV